MKVKAGLAAIPLLMTAPAWPAGPSPVVVELFESQGCSSCPPAERVMSLLGQAYGDSVLLLTHHVDYWDYLGWKDTFSDAAATERQKMFAQAFGQDSIYTPEMVVQGQIGFNGADQRTASREIEARLKANRLRFELSLRKKPAGQTEVAVRLPPALVEEARQLTAVLYENAQPVKVLRGENSGATMSGAFAVRKLVPMPIPVAGRSNLTLALPPGAEQPHLGVAVLVQGPSPSILAAETAPLAVNSL